MPTVQPLKQRAAAIKKKMAQNQGALDAGKLRAMRKRLKRTQRRVRSLEAQAKRLSEKAGKKKTGSAEAASQ